jgi:oligopeptide transport system substrate-binding protein
MARSKNNGPNTANYQSEAFDALFNAMQRRENDPERLKLCRQILSLLEEECPWIPLSHSEEYALYHSWLKNMKPCGVASPTFKYQDIDPARRNAFQKQHNSPILWPLYVALGIFALLFIPAIVTFHRERQ